MATLQDTLALIVMIPAIGAAINGLIGDRLSRPAVSIIGCGASGLAFAYALVAFNALLAMPGHSFLPAEPLFQWIGFGEIGGGGAFDIGINVAFALDLLSATLLLVVTGVGFLIHLYSTGYMAGDPSYHRYFSYLNLFLFAMLILVLADNMVLMFVGWEGVGLASYLLIGFWFKDLNNASAGKKAFIVNRVGDFAFLLAIFLAVHFVGTVNFASISHFFGEGKVEPTASQIATMMGILLFIGACGKSAQIPLHVWLPDAMAGPTPVSALIHAATMVTAGVYMVGRFGNLFAASPLALGIVCIVGATTALFAATIAITQTDIKKVLAYSTVSQLGYMFVGMGLGAAGYAFGIFHLVTHAFFKALLFLGAGAVIHACHHEQDMRNMGGLRSKMPVTFWSFLIGGAALAGVPPFSGFWSKDAILHHTLETAVAAHGVGRWVYGIAFVFGLIAAILTAFYITRLFVMTFLGEGRSEKARHAHEVGGLMKPVLIVLLVLSAIGGFAMHHYWAGWLSTSLPSASGHGGHGGGEHGVGINLEKLTEVLSVLAAILGIVGAWWIYKVKPGTAQKWATSSPAAKRGHALLLNKYYVDEFYQKYIVDALDRTASFLWRIVDVAIIDGLYNDMARGARQAGRGGGRLQNGKLGRYAVLFALGALGIFVGMLVSGPEPLLEFRKVLSCGVAFVVIGLILEVFASSRGNS